MADNSPEMAELRRQLESLARAIRANSSALSSTADELTDYSEDVSDINTKIDRYRKKYQKYLDDLTAYNTEERDERKQYLMSLKQRQLDLVREQTINARSLAIRRQQMEDLQQSIAAHQRAMEITQDVDTYRHHQEAIQDATASLAKLKRFVDGQERLTERVNKLNDVIAQQEQELKRTDYKGMFGAIGEKFKEIGKSFWAKALSGAFAQQVASDVYQTVKHNMSTGIALGLSDYFKTGFKFGLSPKEYSELIAANRQAVVAVGGIENNAKILSKGIEEVFDAVGDLPTATRIVQDQMSLLARSGVRPLANDTQLLAGSFRYLQKTTGQSFEQLNIHMADMIDEESTQATLRAARTQEERRAIIAGTAKRLQENVALGMTIEQAKAAAKTLNQLAGKGPLERLRQAARIRAVGGALGVQGADEAARIIAMGERASQQDRQRAQQILSQISNVITQSATGPMGAEIFATTLTDKMGLDGLLGKNSPLTTTTAEAVKPTEQSVKALGDIDKNIVRAVSFLEQILGAMKMPGGQVLGAAGAGLIGGAIGTVGTIAAGALGRKMFGGLFGGKPPTMPGVAPGTAGTPPPMPPTGTAPIVPPGTSPTTTPPAAGGTTPGRGGRLGRLGGFGMKGIGKMLPFVGTGIAAYGAAESFSQGDYTGAALNGLATIASLFPGIGTAAAFGLSAIDAARGPTAKPSSETQIDKNVLSQAQQNAANVDSKLTQQVELAVQTQRNLQAIEDASKKQVDLLNNMFKLMAMSEEERKKYFSAFREPSPYVTSPSYKVPH